MRIDTGWEDAVEQLKGTMDDMHKAREEALRQCRLLIQTSAKCIRHVHRRQFPEAWALLDQAREIARAARGSLEKHPELLYAGYLQDAEKEMVEAAALITWVAPRPDESAVSE